MHSNHRARYAAVYMYTQGKECGLTSHTGLSSFVLRESKTLKSRETSWLGVWLLEKSGGRNEQSISIKIKRKTDYTVYSLEDDSNSHLLAEQWVSSHFISLCVCSERGGTK